MTFSLFAQTATNPGFLVTFDGPNGSGKTSLAGAVADELRGQGVSVLGTRQPSPTSLGDCVRAAEADVTGRALACLVAGDRHHQLKTEIGPALRDGAVVLCDRYVESSLVLQRMDGVEVQFILAVNAGLLRPDLRVGLLARPEVLDARLAARQPDRARRFEARVDGREQELELYAKAEELLVSEYGLGAEVFDSSDTHVTELGARVAELIRTRLRTRNER